MKFSGLTKKGRLYLAKIQATEEPIQFTKIKFGDGKLSEHENPADLVDIKNIKVEKSILNKEQKEDAVILTTIIDNVGVVEGYFPRETGIYVQDEDQEVLYFYMNDGDETSWLPPEVDGPHRMEMKINLISSNTGSVLVHNDGKDLYITKDYLESNYTQKGNFNGTAQDIEDRVVAAVGQLNGMFPLSEAIAGNIYYHQGNKKFYICKSNYNGTTISVPNMNFEDLSVWDNRKRLENLNSFDILYSKTDDFGNWKDLTISLTKPTDDTKYSHYVIYTGQGNQITNSILVTSTTHLDLYFDCYQYSNPGRVGVAFATFVNSTTVKLKILEGQASGDGIVKILAFKKV
ncbi:phage tail-collar fiber domain-containing protein [Fusobacterium polymorphum]|uniref:phage tail-collar fiber domain-containing protein n=1 Tax=Fusobacterium nucleatum subsp. polymorphum TaxID=76857 RepID=UPI003008CDA6